MSGGYFNYTEWQLQELADRLEELKGNESDMSLLSDRGRNAIPLLHQHLNGLYSVLRKLDHVMERDASKEEFDIVALNPTICGFFPT